MYQASRDKSEYYYVALLHVSGCKTPIQALFVADLVLASGAMPPLLSLLAPEFPASRSMIRNATWTLSNFCRGKPAPDFEVTKAALGTLRTLIMPTQEENDEEIMTDACWALSYLSDGPNERIQVRHTSLSARFSALPCFVPACLHQGWQCRVQ